MKTSRHLFAALSFVIIAALPQRARAHCDSLDGPVVRAAETALATGKIGPVLAWVQPTSEPEIKAAFQKALTVRKLGPEARELADRYFFETLVRVHRGGEGAPHTGLKPAGRDHGPVIPAADKAIASGSTDVVTKLIVDGFKVGIDERFKRLRALKAPGDDAASGREWVEAYVQFIHYAEGVYQAVGKKSAHDEGDEGHSAHE